MGLIQEIVDPTGTMSDMTLNSENISQIIDEMNRSSDQLDAITNSLNIINKGTTTLVLNAAALAVTANIPHGFGSAPIFVAFINRSDLPTLWYPLPYATSDGTGLVNLSCTATTDITNINFGIVRSASGAAITFIISYYILQQPAKIPTGV
jgi:hypothetical protein